MKKLFHMIGRAPRVCGWLLVLFLCNLFFVPVVDDLIKGPAEEVIIGLFTGPMIGQCVIVAILGGLYGTTWIDGFRLAGIAVLIGFSLFVCGIAIEQGDPGGEEFWVVYFAIPGVMFAVLSPLLLMRHFANWRIVDPRRIYPKQLADLSSIFITTAAVALILVALRVPQLVFQTPASTFWITCITTGTIVGSVSGVVTIPLASFVLNCEIASARLVAMGVIGAIAYVVFFVCMMVVGVASGSPMPSEFLTCAGFATLTATLTAMAGIWAIRADGFRLRTAKNYLAITTLPETDEQQQQAKAFLAQHRKRTVLQLLGAFVLMAALNTYATTQHSAKAQFERALPEIRAAVTRFGGNIQEASDNTLSIQFGNQSEARVSEAIMEIYSATRRNRVSTAIVSLDFSKAKNAQVFFLPFEHFAPKLKRLDISNTGASWRDLPRIKPLSLEHFAAERLALGKADWSSLNHKTLKSLVLNGAKIDTASLARFIVQCDELGRLELNDVAVESSFVDALAQLPPGKLEALGLAGAYVDDEDLKQLQDHRLFELNLSRTNLTDACVASLIMCVSQTTELHLAETALTDKGASRLKAISIGRRLDLAGTNITGEAFRDWERFPSILNLSETRVGDELVETFLVAPAVEHIDEERGMSLDLSNTQITDAVLVPLTHGLGANSSVNLSHTKITAKGLAATTVLTEGAVIWTVEKGKFTEQELNSLRVAGVHVFEE